MRPAGSIVVPSGVHVEPHEIATAERLKQLGYRVVFNRINNAPHAKNPDVMIDGECWELKSPQGASEKSTIQDQFKKAQRQARIVVIDLQRCGLPDELALRQIKRRFQGQKRIIRMLVFDHEGQVTELLQDGNL